MGVPAYSLIEFSTWCPAQQVGSFSSVTRQIALIGSTAHPSTLETMNVQMSSPGTSLAVQWLRLHAPTAGGISSIFGQGTKILNDAHGAAEIKINTNACQTPLSWNSPGKNTEVDCHCLLQGILPTQGLNLCLLHCRQTLYYLTYQGSPQYADFS